MRGVHFLREVDEIMYPAYTHGVANAQDTLLLDRCILDQTTKDIDRRSEEDRDRLKVEFQLERSELRKRRREVRARSSPSFTLGPSHHAHYFASTLSIFRDTEL